MSKYAKAIAAALGAIATILTTVSTAHWVTIAVSIITAIAVYLVPNKPAAAKLVKENRP